jgi:cysteine desulfurase/selenocysteine lyase
MSAASASRAGTLDVDRVRRDFPILDQQSPGHRLVFLDSAASAQKPKHVLDVMSDFYANDYANIHRGVYELSQRATDAFEAAREKVRALLNAAETREIVFVRGTTEAINLVASSWGRRNVAEGDEILISAMEHHSNIVPWQLLCDEQRARLVVAPIDDRGQLELDEFERLISPRTRLVAVTHVSNALGSVNPVREITQIAHRHGIPVLLDGAQAVPHTRVDVQDLDCDFYAFSSHKLFGPSGIGALYGKAELLEAMPPYQGGGEMILTVSFEKSTWAPIPHKFEAGTPDIAGVVGLGAAIDYIESIGFDAISTHEHDLLRYGTDLLASIPGLRLIGTADEKAAVLSFVLDGIHPHDVGTILDQQGIAVRTGHHCAQPVMDRFGVPATTRASLALYNTRDELDALAAAIVKTQEMFS